MSTVVMMYVELQKMDSPGAKLVSGQAICSSPNTDPVATAIFRHQHEQAVLRMGRESSSNGWHVCAQLGVLVCGLGGKMKLWPSSSCVFRQRSFLQFNTKNTLTFPRSKTLPSIDHPVIFVCASVDLTIRPWLYYHDCSRNNAGGEC